MSIEEITEIVTAETKAEVLEAAEAATQELMADGLSKEEALDIVFDVLDGVLALKAIMAVVGQPAAGEAAEALSDQVLALLKEWILGYEIDADKIDARAEKAEARGWKRVAARRRKRSARTRDRQD